MNIYFLRLIIVVGFNLQNVTGKPKFRAEKNETFRESRIVSALNSNGVAIDNTNTSGLTLFYFNLNNVTNFNLNVTENVKFKNSMNTEDQTTGSTVDNKKEDLATTTFTPSTTTESDGWRATRTTRRSRKPTKKRPKKPKRPRPGPTKANSRPKRPTVKHPIIPYPDYFYSHCPCVGTPSPLETTTTTTPMPATQTMSTISAAKSTMKATNASGSRSTTTRSSFWWWSWRNDRVVTNVHRHKNGTSWTLSYQMEDPQTKDKQMNSLN